MFPGGRPINMACDVRYGLIGERSQAP
jgi:hypothetical protein